MALAHVIENPVEAGKLTLSVTNQRVEVRFAPSSPRNGLEVHVAILGFDLKTDVRAGENGGRILEHDFVVLGLHEASMTRTQSLHTASFALPETEVTSARRAIAAWVSASGDPGPIQAVGGWLN